MSLEQIVGVTLKQVYPFGEKLYPIGLSGNMKNKMPHKLEK